MLSKLFSTLRSALVCTISLISVCGSAPLGAETFRNPYRIPTTVDPATLAIGDFNGDGRPDIAWVDISTSPHVLHILLAQAGGEYLAAPSITFPTSTTSSEECLTADFNRDGHQDLVCSNAYEFSNSLNVFLGNGDGTFQAPINTSVPAQNNAGYVVPELFSVGDLNGDGFPDLIESEAEEAGLQVLLGRGDGTFKIGVVAQSGINNPPPFVADVNGDGKPDILLGLSPEVELGNGDGTFGAITQYGVSPYPACMFHDIDGDGHLDAVCGSSFTLPSLTVLHGNADGTFNTAPIDTQSFSTTAAPATFMFPMAIYDANGDGVPDILAYAYDGASILLGQSGSSFTYPSHYAAGFMPFDELLPQYQFFVADMNVDGIPDVVSIATHGIYISYGVKDGSLATAPAYEVGHSLLNATVVDFNGDGIPDVAITGDASVELSLGKGDGSFAAYTALPNSNGGIQFSHGTIMHGDFDGDGKQDIIAVGTDNNASLPYLYLGHGDGTFATPAAVASLSLYSSNLTDKASVDINHDGRTDIIVATTSFQGQYIVSNLSNGNGTFTSLSTAVPSDPDIYAVGGYYFGPGFTTFTFGDFNGDGKLDVAYGSLTNAYVLNGHDDGSFDTVGVVLPIPPLNGTTSQGSLAITSADFDGDGNPDIAVLAEYSSTNTAFYTYNTAVWVYYGDGHGGFAAPVLAVALDRGYATLATADLNKDGLADLVLGYHNYYGSLLDLAGGDGLAVVHAQVGRTFGQEIDYTAGDFSLTPFLADLNRDGYPDILVANNGGNSNDTGNSVTVLLNSGIVVGLPTNTTLTCSPNPVSIYSTALLTTAVTSASGTPTGSIAFTDNGAALATQALVSGSANLTYTGLIAGTHTLTATYVPTGGFASSSASCSEVVNGLPTTSVLTVNPTTTTYGSPVTLAATVAPAAPPGPSTPAGVVTFYNGATVVGTGTLANGVASVVLSTLPGGSYNLSCVYGGSSIYAASNCNSVPVVISAAATTLSLISSSNPAPALSPVTFTARLLVNGQAAPAGNAITLSVNGQIVNLTTDATGSASFTISTLTPGSYPVTANFAATNSLLASSASLNEVVTAVPTNTLLSVTPNPAYFSQLVTMVATVAPQFPSAPVPSGSVTFVDGTTPLGTQAVTASGTATFTTSALAIGSHSITATFNSSSSVFVTSTSLVDDEVILPSGFTIAVLPTAITLAPGAAGTVAIQLASVGNFAGPLALTYGTLPANATAFISPATVTLTAGGTGFATLTLNTLLKASNTVPAKPGSKELPVVFTAFVLLLVPFGFSRRNKLARFLGVALMVVALQGITGCTNAWYTASVVASGTYQLPVTATDVNHNSQTATVTVTVTP